MCGGSSGPCSAPAPRPACRPGWPLRVAAGFASRGPATGGPLARRLRPSAARSACRPLPPPAARAAPAPRAPRCGPRCGAGRLGWPALALSAALALGLLRARCACPSRRCGLSLPPWAARPARGPPSAAPLGLRFACPRGSRRGASCGAAPRFFGPRPPGVGGVARRLRAAFAACAALAPSAQVYKAASLASAAPPLSIHAIRSALAYPHEPQSLSASAYNIVTSGRSCSSAACTFARL